MYVLLGVVFAVWATADLICLGHHRLRPAYAVSVAATWVLGWLMLAGWACYLSFSTSTGPSDTAIEIWRWKTMPLLDVAASMVMMCASPSVPPEAWESVKCRSEG